MNPTVRSHIHIGMEVRVVLKKDQSTGKLTPGIVQEILTNQEHHPRGIKVRLADGKVGRVQEIVSVSLSGKRMWDVLVECRAVGSLTELSRLFTKQQVVVNGDVISHPHHLLQDGQYIIRCAKDLSMEVTIAGGVVTSYRKMTSIPQKERMHSS